jgi:hypothetical protein
MARCGFVKDDGRPCERIVKASQRYCYSHDPQRASERKRNAARGGRRGGRGRPVVELAALRDENSDIRRRLLDGKLRPGVAAVAVQSINTDIRAVSAALKAHEQEELAERLEALEDVLKRRTG